MTTHSFLSSRARALRVLSFFAAAAAAPCASAQHVGQFFELYAPNAFTVTDLGAVAGLVPYYGGICFKPGDPNTLLIAEAADSAACVIRAVPVFRDGGGHISGFGVPQPFSTAPGLGDGGLDGSLVLGPGNVLFYTTYPDNTLGQILPGSSAPDKLIDLTALGLNDSTGGCVFIPPGFPAAGEMRILSYYMGQWHHATPIADGAGTYDVTLGPTVMSMSGGPTSMQYVPATTQGFADAYGYASPNGWVIVTKYLGGRVDVYEVDGNGDPLILSELSFIDDVDGAVGMVFDPTTGDLLISTFLFDDRIVRVSGFLVPGTPCPADLTGDGIVDGGDLGLMIAAWGSAGAGDLNLDGLIDGGDLGLLIAGWGSCPD